MRSHRRRTLFAAALAPALLASACGDDSTTAETTTTTEATPMTDAPTTTAPDDGAIEVMVAGGAVVGGGGVEKVAVGESVALKVTSDAADHVHVHGYDLFTDIAAGDTVTVEFTADIPGVFEVELEDSGLLLLELEVS